MDYEARMMECCNLEKFCTSPVTLMKMNSDNHSDIKSTTDRCRANLRKPRHGEDIKFPQSPGYRPFENAMNFCFRLRLEE